MPARKSPAQIRSQLRQAQQKSRQAQQKARQAQQKLQRAANNLDQARRQYVRDVNRAIDRHNAGVRRRNAQRQRLQRELETAARRPPTTVRVQYRTSVDRFTTSFQTLERQAIAGGWADSEVFDLTSGEAANSVAALNALLDPAGTTEATDDEVEDLQRTDVDRQLAELDEEFAARWQGALFSLNPKNPDAARHFCSSAREMLANILSTVAPADDVTSDDPDCARTDDGKVTRRARIRYCLRASGLEADALTPFVDEDIDNVLELFGEFNDGTHGAAGRFTLDQLRTLKRRVEDAVTFVLWIAPAR